MLKRKNKYLKKTYGPTVEDWLKLSKTKIK